MPKYNLFCNNILNIYVFLNLYIYNFIYSIPIHPIQNNYETFYTKSMKSYCDISYLTKYNNIVIYNNNTNNLLYFDTNENEINIVFRGTDFYSFINWKNNLKFNQEPYNSIYMNCNNCYLHTGFYHMYYSLVYEYPYSLYNQYFDTIFSNNKTINIIGHSLGGALSTILFFELNFIKELYPNIYQNQINLYTFGSPRVANNDFIQHLYKYHTNIYRFVNKNDIIPHLPPSSMNYHGKYSHVHREYYINQYDNIIKCDINEYYTEDPNCSYSVRNPTSVENHLNYFNKKDEINSLFEICKNDKNNMYQELIQLDS